MKLFLLFISMSFFFLTTTAQPAIQWQKVYGGSVADFKSYAVDVTGDGGYITAGGFSNGYNVNAPATISSFSDAVLIKFDAAGNVIWKKQYGDQNFDVFNSVQHTSDGGYIAAGSMGDIFNDSYAYIVKTNATGDIMWQKTLTPERGGINSVKQTSDGGYIVAGIHRNVPQPDMDMYLAKLDAAGNVLWEKSYGGESEDYANSIQQTSDGGFVVSGFSGSTLFRLSDGSYVSSGQHGQDDYVILKLDASGAVQWYKYLGGSGEDFAYAAVQTTDGGYMLAGSSTSTNGDVTGNHGNGDYWVVKTNSTGVIQWQKSYGGSAFDGAYGIQQTTDGNYIVTGSGLSNDGQVTGHHGTNARADAWVLKIDNTGNIIWQNSIGSNFSEYGRQIVQTASGFIMTGPNTSKNFNSNGYSSSDYWLVNLDNNGAVVWQTISGASGGNNVAKSIEQTTDGGYITAGYANSNNGDVSGGHGSYDGWVVKTNNVGAIQWSKSLGGINDEYISSIKKTNDGGYVVAGTTSSADGDITSNHGNSDFWVVKLSTAGVIQWQKTYGGTGFDSATAIQQTTDGGYIVAGRSSSNNGDVSGNHGGYDYWIIKLDASGNLSWQKSYGGSADEYAYAIEQTTDGGYIVSGRTSSTDGNVTGNHGNIDYWVLKLDASGNLAWQKCLGGSGSDISYCIHQTLDGGYIVGGSTTSTDGNVTGLHGTTYSDFWIVKLDPAGNITWQKTLGSNDIETAFDILQTADGNYIAGGGSGSTLNQATNGDVTGNHGSSDYWMTKIDPSGNLIWQKSLGGSLLDYLYSIKVTSDGGFIAAGSTSSKDGDVTGNIGTTNYWVVKLTGQASSSQLTDYFRTRQAGNWNDMNTWESSGASDFSSGTISPVTLIPDYNSNTITLLHNVTLTSNLTIDQTVINSGDTLFVNPNVALTVNDGTGTDVTVNGGLTIRSTAAGTGSIGRSTGTISGNVTVERYISDKRSWRLLGVPFGASAQTIKSSWMEAGNNTTGFGTQVTTFSGDGNAANFDATKPASSIRIYSGNSFTSDATHTPNTTNLITHDSAYFLFVRGNRSIDLNNTIAHSAATLRITGTPYSGSVTKGLTTSTFSLVSNPYLSALDFDSVKATNPSISAFYVWDATLGTVGQYRTVQITGTGPAYNYTATPGGTSNSWRFIESGTAFFIPGSAAVNFTEAMKTAGIPPSSMLRTPSVNQTELVVNLYAVNADNTISLADGIREVFDNNYAIAINNNDAKKIAGFDLNLGISSSNKILAIEKRPMPNATDIISLNLAGAAQGNYQFEVQPFNFPAGLTPYLKDNYLGTYTPIDLSADTKINFSITIDAASSSQSRFSIVFSKPNINLQPSIVVYPNPVQNGLINLQMNNMPKGIYSVRLLNALGQTVLTKQINHAEGSSTEMMSVSKITGMYLLEIAKPDNVKIINKIIIN